MDRLVGEDLLMDEDKQAQLLKVTNGKVSRNATWERRILYVLAQIGCADGVDRCRVNSKRDDAIHRRWLMMILPRVGASAVRAEAVAHFDGPLLLVWLVKSS